jgi:hypothetical protein
MVDVFAQTFGVSSELSLLEIRKGKGDILEYYYVLLCVMYCVLITVYKGDILATMHVCTIYYY